LARTDVHGYGRTEQFPDNPDRMNIAFRASTDGLHSAEN
jgi:hypothetical protein